MIARGECEDADDGFNWYVKNYATGAWVSASALGAGGANTDANYKGYGITLTNERIYQYISSDNRLEMFVVNRVASLGTDPDVHVGVDLAYVQITYENPALSVPTVFISNNTYDSATSSSIVITKPPHTVAGDLMLALINRDSETDSNSVPSGWTLLGSNKATYGWWLYYKEAGSSEGANYTWGFAASAKSKGTIATYRSGFVSGDPIDNYSNTAYTNGLDYNARVASFSVANTEENLIYAASVYSTSTRSFTKPTALDNDWIEDYDNGNTDPDFSQTFGHCNWSSSGNTGDIDITISTILTAKHAFAVALNNVVASSFIPKIIMI